VGRNSDTSIIINVICKFIEHTILNIPSYLEFVTLINFLLSTFDVNLTDLICMQMNHVSWYLKLHRINTHIKFN